MTVSSVSTGNNGYAILQKSREMADSAAKDLQQAQALEQQDALKFNKASEARKEADAQERARERHHPDTVDSLTKLNQAQQYNRAGVSVIQRERDMLGSMLDLRV